MKTYKLHSYNKKILADTFTPVNVYLKLRDKYPNSILLESSDYHSKNNSFSYICCNPIATFLITNSNCVKTYPDESVVNEVVYKNATNLLGDFSKQFITDKNDFKFISNGLFGYISYDAIKYFDTIEIRKKENSVSIPEIQYAIYQNIIAINHYNNEAYIFCNSYDDSNNINEIEQILNVKNIPTYSFSTVNNEISNISDQDFLNNVAIAKQHCKLGNVFQLVLSKRFSQEFKGDEFNVYRALRNINPSPYLFYFDYGDFKIFGSSPEAQLVVKNNIAEIHPIAGTFKRTGNDLKDAELAIELSNDPKENSEHVMLVDLARNDLSKHCSNVEIDKYKEIQYFSHVIHLVSKVTGNIKKSSNTLDLVSSTFPAGTLSGAPKYKALQLIEEIEKTNRSFYGGAIGFMDFNGNFNHAITIRSFLSKNHNLYYQAGAGIVNSSIPENELQEVYNKIEALKKALTLAQNI